MAYEAHNTKFFFSNTTASSTASTCLIGGVVTYNGPGGNAAVINVTHLLSTAHEKLQGLPDEGQITLACNYLSTDDAQILLRSARMARAKRSLRMKMVQDSTIIFDADVYCTQFAPAGGVDAKSDLAVTLEITGAGTWSTA